VLSFTSNIGLKLNNLDLCASEHTRRGPDD
jgi:hypothetical protein